MKTADLIAALSNSAKHAPPWAMTGRLAAATAVGAAVAFAILVGWLGLRPMHDAVLTPSFWMKGAYTLALSAAGLMWVGQLARPTGKLGVGPVIILLIVSLMLILGGLELARTPKTDITHAWLGDSWAVCPLRILTLATPVYLGVALTLRRLAPTRLIMTGAAAGLLAGAVGATFYGLYCRESTAAFTATWYTLGIAASAAAGGLLGPRLLRW